MSDVPDPETDASPSDVQAAKNSAAPKKGGVIAIIALLGLFAGVGFAMGMIKGILREDGGGAALGFDLGWKHALLLMLLVLMVTPIGSLLKSLKASALISGVVIMSLSFGLMWVGGTVIEGEYSKILSNLLSGMGQGAIVGVGLGTVDRLGWAKSPFDFSSRDPSE